MSSDIHVKTPVSAEEIERRLDEYRRLGFQWKVEPQIVYKTADQACPWTGCSARIAGIKFQLEKLGDGAQLEKWLTCWWKGEGLVGPCPQCKRLVRFGLDGKEAIRNASAASDALLPDDWATKARVVFRSDEN